MSFLTDLYDKTLSENYRNMYFWESYLQDLKSLDFNAYSDKLRVPVLVPVGSRILFRGELKHTNEITIALGADYFVKCSVKQAEVLRQHRMKDAEAKLEGYRKEREYIESKVSFANENIFKNQGQEIVEVYTDDEDRAWREKHKENVKQWKQKKRTYDEPQEKLTDEELWNRLEELELQEELENELTRDGNVYLDVKESFVVKEETILEKKSIDHSKIKDTLIESGSVDKKVQFREQAKETENLDLLQKVRDKQNELEEKLLELKNQDRGKSKTEEDLIAKLDKLEMLEELEDEMERLEDIIETEDVTSEEELDEENAEDISKLQSSDSKRRVSFADLDESETLELTFHHSNKEACKEPYDAKKGITKPSDVYLAFSNNFTETTSILKKTKYEDKVYEDEKVLNNDKKMPITKRIGWSEDETNQNRTIIVKDVVEKVDKEDISDGAQKRPMSLFKQRRQQKKSQ